MKLIYISHWRFPSEKTMSPLIMKMCEMFVKKGYDVELWVPWRQNALSKEDAFFYHGILRNFAIRRLPALDFTGLSGGDIPFYLLLTTFNVSVLLYALFLRPSCSALFYFHDARDAVLLSLPRPRMFLEIHDFYKSSLSFLNRWVFRRVEGFVVTNRIKMGFLEKDFGIPESRMLHMPNGVDVRVFRIDTPREEARKKLSLPEDQKIILYTGHLFDWKGVDALFDAHQYLREGESIYFVGGTDEDIERFRIRNKELRIKSVKIVGRRPHAEIPAWLRAADVLVLPNSGKSEASKNETSPVKLFEYMASGRPIVASDLPSIRDIVNDRMVFFAKPDDPRSFADVIHSVFISPRAKETAKAARDEVEKFSWEKRVGAVTAFFERLSSKK